MSWTSRVARNAIAAHLIEKREWKMLTSTCLLKPSSDLLHLYQYRKSKRQIEFMDQWKINQFSLEKPKYHSSYLSLLFCFHISHCTQHFYTAVNQFKWSIHASYCTAHTPSLRCNFALCGAAEAAQITMQPPDKGEGPGTDIPTPLRSWWPQKGSAKMLDPPAPLFSCKSVHLHCSVQLSGLKSAPIILLSTNLMTVLPPHQPKAFCYGWHKHVCLSRLLVLSSFFKYLSQFQLKSNSVSKTNL